MSVFNMNNLKEFLKEGSSTQEENFELTELAKLFCPEDVCFHRAITQYQSILDDAKDDFNFIIDKYVFYQNKYLEGTSSWYGGPNDELDFLRELCAILEKRIVTITLESSGYKGNITNKYIRWEKG